MPTPLMNDAQKEYAARQLCTLRGLSQEGLVVYTITCDGTTHQALQPRWMQVKNEIEAEERLQQAMEAGQNYVPPPPAPGP